jgi:hypothetical protein
MSRRDPRQWRRNAFGGGFSPKSIPGLALWLDSGHGITATTTVSSWADTQSGSGITFTQASGTNRPTFNTTDSGYAGRPSLSFSGNQWLDSGTVAIAQPDTWVIVGKETVAGGSILDAASGARQLTGSQAGTNFFNIYAGGTGLISAVTIATPSVMASIFNGASSAGYVNNSQSAVLTGNPGSNGMTEVEIGANAGTSGFFTGSVAAILNYSTVLSATQMKLVFAYLGSRFGIAVS